MAAGHGGKFTQNKLAPSISPGKSWEGVWGGVIGVVIVASVWILADHKLHATVPIRFPWRGVVLNWLSAGGIITVYLVLALMVANAGGGSAAISVLVPQILLSILAYPIAARLVGAIDRFRLIPIITV